MSLSDPRAKASRYVPHLSGGRAVLASFVCLLLAGCESGGFRPLYATGPGGNGVNAKLSQIDIATIPSRVGQRVRNELIFENNGGALPAPPSYRLNVAIRESLVSTLVRSDGEAASQIYNLDAKFSLIRLSDKKVILEGTSFGRAGFERYTQIYSNVRAREDAENRAAKTIATDMKSRLAAFLSTAD
jgi:LPS-assembly lipoprotein